MPILLAISLKVIHLLSLAVISTVPSLVYLMTFAEPNSFIYIETVIIIWLFTNHSRTRVESIKLHNKFAYFWEQLLNLL